MTGRVFTFFPEMDSERTVEFEATNGLIDAIVLPGDYGNRTELDIPMPSVGDMLVWLGGPSCIQPQGHYSGQDFVFNSESATLTITLRGNALVPTQPIYRLSSQPYNTVANPCREATTTRWRGFVSVDR